MKMTTSSLVASMGGVTGGAEEDALGTAMLHGTGISSVSAWAPPPSPDPTFVSESTKQEILSEAEQRFIARLADGISIEFEENSIEWTRRGVSRAYVDFFLAALSQVCGS